MYKPVLKSPPTMRRRPLSHLPLVQPLCHLVDGASIDYQGLSAVTKHLRLPRWYIGADVVCGPYSEELPCLS